MMDGTELEGRIKNFDRFAVILDHDGADQMLFKHAIAAIRTPRPVANYFSHQ
jgi:RNA chaperone Hfq